MNAINAIFTRRSTRQFTEQPIENEKLHQILDAALSGPCCVNARDWSFVVVREKDKLEKMAEANGAPARPQKMPPQAFSFVEILAVHSRQLKTTGSLTVLLLQKTFVFVLIHWGLVRYGLVHGLKWIVYSASKNYLICRIP